ncbi:hypothetical protein [Oscillibacter sp.]|uniref:hypothetical protein n=1 Tax=Oscillibacter sp. TaxID=1945593 RepID=UPI00339B5178
MGKKLNCAFKPYPFAWINETGKRYEISLVVLTKEDQIVKMTTLHNYIGDKKRTKLKYKQNSDDVRRICNFLNYVLFDNHWLYNTSNIADIPFSAVKSYISDYSSIRTRFGYYPSAQSVEKERNAVCLFMANISQYRKDKKQHYYAKQIQGYSLQNNSVIPVSKWHENFIWNYEIQAEYVENTKNKIIRDIPQDAIHVILKWIRLKAPDLYFAVILQLCAGLREGEVVNIRRATSCYYGGIQYTKENGQLTSFQVDLTSEYQLRSDGKAVGNIKRHRRQCVYPPLLLIVQKAYENHLKIVDDSSLETEKPMFANTYTDKTIHKKLALQKQSYCNRIERIVEKYVIPELLKSNNIELHAFALSVNENGWGLHAFRHWYTVQLVLNGEDANSIAFFRGDSSTKTAFWYIQNKGELLKRYTKVNDQISNELLQTISRMELTND